MSEAFFQPLHLLLLLISAGITFGTPFIAGYYLGRYVERKKWKQPRLDK
jgi:hypothetical protein